MKSALLLLVVVTVFCQSSCTVVNKGKDIFCARAQITDVRIQGCAAEPCIVRKGTHLPVEIDFSFQTPSASHDTVFQVFNPYWNAPGTGVYGEYIGTAYGCASSFPGETCPLRAQTRYTQKSSIFIHPDSKDTLTGAPTGERNTQWSLTFFDDDKIEYSACNFQVDIKIVV